MNYHEYVYIVLLYFALTALLGLAYGWLNIATGSVIGMCGLLVVSIKKENDGWR